MIIQTEAIVLNTKRFSESSLILTLFSLEKGKISVMVKGALKAKNKYGNSLLLMSISNVTIYWKENRELQIMSDSESKFKLNNISNSLEKIASGLAIIELLNAFVPIEDPNIDIYNLTVNSLKTLNDSNINESILLSLIHI